MIIVIAAGALFSVALFAFLVRERRLGRIRSRRESGLDGFLASLPTGSDQDVAKHVYDALCEERGNDVLALRADDSLSDLYGIVDDDIDDVMTNAARRANVSIEALSAASDGRLIGTARDAVDVLSVSRSLSR